MPPTAPKFIYLLHAMEHAARQDNPSEHGYAEKRRAVLQYVAEAEKDAARLRSDLACVTNNTYSETELEAANWRACQMWHGLNVEGEPPRGKCRFQILAPPSH